jgi:hypothetical protein
MDDHLKIDHSTFYPEEDIGPEDTTQLIGEFLRNMRRCFSADNSIVWLVSGTLWLMGAVIRFIIRYLEAFSECTKLTSNVL